jgi:hypothetical protein
MKSIDMREHFQASRGAILGTVPQNAWNFGLVIQDRNLRGSAFGLKKVAIPFQYLQDGAIPAFSKQATYEDTQIPGRFEPIKTYTSSSSNEFTLALTYVAEGSENIASSRLKSFNNVFIQNLAEATLGRERFVEEAKTFWTIEQIERISSKIESLVFPQYDRSYSPPRFCLMNIGSVYVDFPVIIKSIEIQHKSPYSVASVKPFRRDINITLSSYFPTYQAISAKDIIDTALQTNFSTSSKTQPRQVYSFRKFNSRSR